MLPICAEYRAGREHLFLGVVMQNCGRVLRGKSETLPLLVVGAASSVMVEHRALCGTAGGYGSRFRSANPERQSV